MVQILPFPLSRRARLVRKQAAWFVAQESRPGAERNLAHALRVQANALAAKGIPQDEISQELDALETAIRAAVARIMLTGVAG